MRPPAAIPIFLLLLAVARASTGNAAAGDEKEFWRDWIRCGLGRRTSHLKCDLDARHVLMVVGRGLQRLAGKRDHRDKIDAPRRRHGRTADGAADEEESHARRVEHAWQRPRAHVDGR